MDCRYESARLSSASCRHVAACVLFATASGCSFVAVRPPPDHVRSRTPESRACTDSYTAPTTDTLIGGGFALTATALALAAASHEKPVEDCAESDYVACGDWGLAPDSGALYAAGAVLLAIPALVYATSAAYGYVNVGKCRDAAERGKREPLAKAAAIEPPARAALQPRVPAPAPIATVPRPVDAPAPIAAAPIAAAPRTAITPRAAAASAPSAAPGGTPLERARQALDAGDPQRARDLATDAIGREPTRAAAYIVLAAALDALGDRRGMQAAFRTCVERATDALASACRSLSR